MKDLRIGDECPQCHKDKVQLIEENQPWSDEHLWCESCNSTFGMSTDYINEVRREMGLPENKYVKYSEVFKTQVFNIREYYEVVRSKTISHCFLYFLKIKWSDKIQ